MSLDYQLEKRIARGGEAEVYRGRLADGRPIAVKVVDSGGPGQQRLVREAQALAHLPRHRNVRGYLAVQVRDGQVHLLQEWIEGITLRTLLRRREQLSITTAMHVIREVLVGLAECIHQAGLVHRDLSPSNILLTSDGRVKIADLGIAKSWGDRPTKRVTRGTLPYLSPEQARGEPLDGRSDLFALGCVLYELILGERVFQGTDSEILSKLISDTPVASPRVRAPELPADLDALVLRLLAKDRTQRYPDVEAALQDWPPIFGGRMELRRELQAAGRSVAPGLQSSVSTRVHRRSGWRFALIFAAAASVGLGVALPQLLRGEQRSALDDQGEPLAPPSLEQSSVDQCLGSEEVLDEWVHDPAPRVKPASSRPPNAKPKRERWPRKGDSLRPGGPSLFPQRGRSVSP